MQVLVIGGKGFVGSHLMQKLCLMGIETAAYDLIDGQDARDLVGLTVAMRHFDTVIHLASNADISAATKCPTLDFDCGTVITQTVVEACRLSGVQNIVYFSGSGVYPDSGTKPLGESEGPLMASSPYGASKIAGEALVSAYCHMFGMRGIVLRPANIVGSDQTHGVGYDFISKLRKDPERLEILGDGTQSKAYIAVSDVIRAIFVALEKCQNPYSVLNVATLDYLTVREIADMASAVLNVKPTYEFTGGDRGWKGDIPVVRLDTTAIRDLGWKPSYTSKMAMRLALDAMANDAA